MEPALIGALSVLVGIGVTKVYDYFAERSRRERDDTVWRRQRTLDAADQFLQTTGHLHLLGRTISGSGQQALAAGQAGDAETVRELQVSVNAQQRDKLETLTAANNALSRLGLLLSQDAYLACSLYFEAVTMRPHDADTGGLAAHINNVLRADCGLPPREIATGTGITVQQYRQKIDELRRAH